MPPLPSAVRLIRHTSMDPHCAVANVQNFSGSADEAARDSDRASQIPTAAGSDTSSLPGLRAAGEHIHLLRCECGEPLSCFGIPEPRQSYWVGPEARRSSPTCGLRKIHDNEKAAIPRTSEIVGKPNQVSSFAKFSEGTRHRIHRLSHLSCTVPYLLAAHTEDCALTN